MSVTVNCFEGLKIDSCTLPSLSCCRRNGTASLPATKTNGVVFIGAEDEEADVPPYHFCVVQVAHHTITSIGPGDSDEDVNEWDTMLVDVDHCIVTLDGKRWPHLMFPTTNPRGQDLSILRPTPRNVCESLVKLALSGKSKQMNTICNNENMTMIACPVYYDKTVVGVQLTYKPTMITEDDVLRIISQDI
jgi:hypothetical protein